MSFAHGVIPFGLADRQQRWLATIRYSDHRRIHLEIASGSGVMNHSVPDLGRQLGEHIGRVVQGPIPAGLLEVRTEDIADEPASAGAPDPVRASGALQLVPHRPHDRVIEANQRFGDAEGGPVVPEDVGISEQQSYILEHIQGVGDIGSFSFQVIGDSAASRVPVGHRTQNRQIQCRIT